MTDEISQEDLQRAERRWDEEVGCFPPAVNVRFDSSWKRVVITLATGLEIALDPTHFEELAVSSNEALASPEIWAGGYDIYFPSIDVDIYLPHVYEKYLVKRNLRSGDSGYALLAAA